MKIRTTIKKYGNASVVVITQENLKLHKFKLGDIVDVEINKPNKISDRAGK